jgi:hypothetical protein
MPTVGDAKMAARTWIQEKKVSRPDFIGAYLIGSILDKSDTDTFPETSDIDIAIVIDSAVPSHITEPGNPLSPRKLMYRGLILEPSYISWEAIKDPETVLSDRHLAAPFVEACILSDPRGEIDRVHRAVRPEFARRRWIRERCKNAAEAAFQFCDFSAIAPSIPENAALFLKISSLLVGILSASCIPVIRASGNSQCGRDSLSPDRCC